MIMKSKISTPESIKTISEWHRIMSLPKPQHPLISIVFHKDVTLLTDKPFNMVMDFYLISNKKSFKGKMRYGKNYYDFDEGTMTFISPGQVIAVDEDESRDCEGWSLAFHPDLIRNYQLNKKIKTYGYFAYDVNEALHLSDKEQITIDAIVNNIINEYNSSIDHYSQDLMVSHLEVLLNYANRFYNRQFITRKTASNDLLSKLETLMDDYFETAGKSKGLPTVHYFSDQLNVSPSYLSDMLRTLTGQNTQQHIHKKLIEKAKEVLTTTNLSVSEIAYQFGFEYPQSFNKLFKSKTNLSPLAYRNSFN